MSGAWAALTAERCGYVNRALADMDLGGPTGSYGESPPWIGMPVGAGKNPVNWVACQSFEIPNPTG